MNVSLPRVLRLTLMVVAPLPGLGCSASHPVSSELLLRDSAGVRIAEYEEFSDAGAPRWTTSPLPEVSLGEVSGADPFLFARIRGAQPLPDGGIVVADGQSMELRFFEESGRHLRTVGGEGSGPGEFTRLWSMFSYRGDSLAAVNAMDRSISVFSSQGEWSRSVTLLSGPGSLVGGFVEGGLESGAFLVRSMQQFQTEAPIEGYLREPSAYQLFSAGGGAGPVLKELPDVEMETRRVDGRLRTFRLDMGRRAASVLMGDEVVLGVTDRLELWRFGPEGTLKGILRVGIPPLPLDGDVVERFMEHVLAGEPDAEAARRLRQDYRDRIWPDSLPVFSELKGDSEGNLWVRKFAPDYAPGPSQWWVFGKDGTLRALATLPQGLRVESIGSDFVLGVTRDELDVERVVRFGLEKG